MAPPAAAQIIICMHAARLIAELANSEGAVVDLLLVGIPWQIRVKMATPAPADNPS